MKRRILSVLVLCAVLLSLLAGCGAGGAGGSGGPSGGTSGSEQVLKVRIGADISGLDPANMFNIENQVIARNIFNALVKYNEETNEIIPDLAESWTISPDGLEYTFQLRQGVQFHKGYGEFTSEDVRFTFERMMDPKGGSRYTSEFMFVNRVEAPDPYTFKFIMNRPDSSFLHKVSAFSQGFVVSKKAVEERGDEYNIKPIGTGPFVFEEWLQGTQVTLLKNPDYFEGPAKLDKVVCMVIPEETAAEIALSNGEIDLFMQMANPDVILRLTANDKFTVKRRPANHTLNMVMNPDYNPVLADVRVRQAIAYALNLESLCTDFFQGQQTVGVTVLTSQFLEYNPDVKKYPYDPEKAKQLLAEAGYANGFDLDLNVVALYPHDKLVVPVAADLQAVGINAKIVVHERAAFSQVRTSGNVDTVFTALVGPPDPASPLMKLFHSSSFPPGLNTAHYTGVDDLIEQAMVTTDDAARMEIYHEIQRVVMEDVPIIPLYETNIFCAMSKRIQGHIQNSLSSVSFYPIYLA